MQGWRCGTLSLFHAHKKVHTGELTSVIIFLWPLEMWMVRSHALDTAKKAKRCDRCGKTDLFSAQFSGREQELHLFLSIFPPSSNTKYEILSSNSNYKWLKPKHKYWAQPLTVSSPFLDGFRVCEQVRLVWLTSCRLSKSSFTPFDLQMFEGKDNSRDVVESLSNQKSDCKALSTMSLYSHQLQCFLFFPFLFTVVEKNSDRPKRHFQEMDYIVDYVICGYKSEPVYSERLLNIMCVCVSKAFCCGLWIS